jgi:allantoin racemase
MRIHIINPNTTVSMTRKIEAAARAAASPGVEILAANPAYGPPSIEGYFDEAFSLPGLLVSTIRASKPHVVPPMCRSSALVRLRSTLRA